MSMQQSEARRERLREERAEARRLGVPIQVRTAVDKTWTPAEDATVRALFPDYQAIHDVMRHRSYYAIKKRARHLGVVPTRHIWTNVEEKKLRGMFATATPAELRAAFPGLSVGIITKKGRRLGLGQRPAVEVKSSGNRLCDAIKARCRMLGYTMRELDKMANTGEYYSKCTWRGKSGHRITPMMKALRLLGGELSVVWPDDGESIDTIDVGEG